MTSFKLLEPREKAKKSLYYFALALGGIASVWLASYVPNADWYGTFDPVGRDFLHGLSPYTQPLFVNPPWTVLILVPFVLFPSPLARGLVLVCSVAALLYTAWRLGAPRIAVAAILLSPTLIGSLLAANLDSFVLLGVFLPSSLALLVLMIKPQIGVGVAIYYLVETWRNFRLVGVVRTFAPVVIAYVVCGILFPVWINRLLLKPENVWNRSLFPYGVPVGLFFLWLSFKNRNVFFALASAPFFAPYLTFYTYLIVQVGLLHKDVEKVIRRDLLQVILCALLWTIMLVFRL